MLNQTGSKQETDDTQIRIIKESVIVVVVVVVVLRVFFFSFFTKGLFKV